MSVFESPEVCATIFTLTALKEKRKEILASHDYDKKVVYFELS
jgi:hypothetical protein